MFEEKDVQILFRVFIWFEFVQGGKLNSNMAAEDCCH